MKINHIILAFFLLAVTINSHYIDAAYRHRYGAYRDLGDLLTPVVFGLSSDNGNSALGSLLLSA